MYNQIKFNIKSTEIETSISFIRENYCIELNKKIGLRREYIENIKKYVKHNTKELI